MITLPDLRRYCHSKKGVTEDFPFDMTTLAFKVGNKIFALLDIDEKPIRVNLKCDPFLSLELRRRYKQITPGYHMNKKHWNTIIFDGVIPDKELLWLIDHSYNLVFNNLKAGDKKTIERL